MQAYLSLQFACLCLPGISLHNFPEGMAVFLGSIKVLHIFPLFFSGWDMSQKYYSSCTLGERLQVKRLNFLHGHLSRYAFKIVSFD
jgi:hypothetical protein